MGLRLICSLFHACHRGGTIWNAALCSVMAFSLEKGGIPYCSSHMVLPNLEVWDFWHYLRSSFILAAPCNLFTTTEVYMPHHPAVASLRSFKKLICHELVQKHTFLCQAGCMQAQENSGMWPEYVDCIHSFFLHCSTEFLCCLKPRTQRVLQTTICFTLTGKQNIFPCLLDYSGLQNKILKFASVTSL